MSLYKLVAGGADALNTRLRSSTQLFSNLSKGCMQQVRFRRSTGRVRNQKAAEEKLRTANHAEKMARWSQHVQRMEEQQKHAIEAAIERQRKHRELLKNKLR